MQRHPWNSATEQERMAIASQLRDMVRTPGWRFLEEFIRFRIDYIKERIFDADIDTEKGRREIGMWRQERLCWETLLKRPEEWVRSADGLLESQSEEEADG